MLMADLVSDCKMPHGSVFSKLSHDLSITCKAMVHVKEHALLASAFVAVCM